MHNKNIKNMKFNSLIFKIYTKLYIYIYIYLYLYLYKRSLKSLPYFGLKYKKRLQGIGEGLKTSCDQQSIEQKPKFLFKTTYTFRLRLAPCTFSKCKIFSSENIFWKRKYFQVFGNILKNALKNIFKCLAVFLKML